MLRLIISAQCLFLQEIAVPSPKTGAKRFAIHRSILEKHILLPMRQKVAGSVVFRVVAAALAVLIAAVFLDGMLRQTNSQDILKRWRQLAEQLSAMDRVSLLIESAAFWGGLYLVAAVTSVLPGLKGLTHAKAPQDFFDGADRKQNPVGYWLFNLFHQVKLKGVPKERYEAIMRYLDDARDESAQFRTSVNSNQLYKACEQKGMPQLQFDHLRLAAGRASMLVAGFHLLLMVLSFVLVVLFVQLFRS